jgi:prephenate dehydrogenase
MKIAIIGGSGKMGRWLARFLLQEGKEVVLIGRDRTKLDEARRQLDAPVTTSMEAAGDADAVLISVPIDSFEEVVAQLAPHTRPSQIILDIASVKVLPVAAMHRHIKRGQVLGTHPVFGPGARGIAGHNIVLTPTSKEEAALAEKVKAYLEARGAKVHIMSPQAHDDMMAVILGLAHYIAIVSADSLVNFERLREMEAIGGITYKVLLTLVESVISEDAGFYASLQMNLPHLPQIQRSFQKSCQAWADLVERKDRQEFVRRMEAIRSRLEANNPDFGKAYDNMYRIAEGL